MKTDSVYVILYYKGEKERPQLAEFEAFEKKSDAKKRLKDGLKEKHKEDKKSDFWREVDRYIFIDGKKDMYTYWVEKLVLN